MHEILFFLKDYLIVLNIVFAAVIIFFERRKTVVTLFWLTLLLLTPYVGFIMYLFFGLKLKKQITLKKYYSFGNSRRHIKHALMNEIETIKKWKTLSRYLSSTLLGDITYKNNFKFYEENNLFFDELKLKIQNANKSIYMEYFIFDDDEVGGPILDALSEKAKAGLEIKIIIDGVGSRKISKKRIKELEQLGIDVEIFFKSYSFLKFTNLKTNYRDHRKMTIVDNKICFSGGLNIGKDYVGKGRLGNWQDIGFSIQGEAVVDYLYEFECNWKFLKKNKSTSFKNAIVEEVKEITPIQVVSSGPNYEHYTMKDTFLNMVVKAKKSIHIETPYFIPDDSILDALKFALLAGIEVKIVIPSVGDHAFVYWVNQYFCGELLELGAKIYRYKDGFIHSKLIVVDEEIALVGTANFDYRSMFQNFEISILLFAEHIPKFEKRIEKDIENSREYTLDDYRNRSTVEKIKESISKLFSLLM